MSLNNGLSEEGLEAAHAAYAKTTGGLLDGHPMANAITAYLSASPIQADGLEVVAWECVDLIMFGQSSVITDVDHAAMRKLQPKAWAVEDLVRSSQAQSALAAMKGEIERLTEANGALMRERTSLIETKREQIERLENRAEVAEYKLHQSVNEIQPLIISRAETAEARIEALEEALEPFAAEAEELAAGIPGDAVYAMPDFPDLGVSAFTVEDLRRARAALSEQKP